MSAEESKIHPKTGLPRTWPQSIKHTINVFLERHMPEGIYARSLIIIIAPIVILQTVVTVIFMDRHWERVTRYLSRGLIYDVSMTIALFEREENEAGQMELLKLTNEKYDFSTNFQTDATLPVQPRKPLLSLLHYRLAKEIRRRIGLPYWIDTLGTPDYVDIRIQLNDGVLRIVTPLKRVYARNWHIFLIWMLATSALLLGLAIIFLRGQIRPIQHLATAAEQFGMGRHVPDFEPKGAREVKQAAIAFIQMKERIERQVEQRTAMLAGVSHDLRTLLTRFKLELAMLPDSEQTGELQQDVKEMQNMLEDYMAFARGTSGEATTLSNIETILNEISQDYQSTDCELKIDCRGNLIISLRRSSFKRCLTNIIDNACKHGSHVVVRAENTGDHIEITTDDDGEGVPEAERESVFQAFYRIDSARNQDIGGTGLGLSIAQDIAFLHGGTLKLTDSDLGGLRVILSIPV